MGRATDGSRKIQDLLPSQVMSPSRKRDIWELATKRAKADHKRGKMDTNVQRTRKLLFDNDLPSSVEAYLLYAECYCEAYAKL